MEMKIDSDSLLIDGSVFGKSDDICYLALFKNEVNQKAWFFGQILLSKYYMVFDSTPNLEDTKYTNAISFAPINPDGLTREVMLHSSPSVKLDLKLTNLDFNSLNDTTNPFFPALKMKEKMQEKEVE